MKRLAKRGIFPAGAALTGAAAWAQDAAEAEADTAGEAAEGTEATEAQAGTTEGETSAEQGAEQAGAEGGAAEGGDAAAEGAEGAAAEGDAAAAEGDAAAEGAEAAAEGADAAAEGGEAAAEGADAAAEAAEPAFDSAAAMGDALERMSDLPILGQPEANGIGWQFAATELARDIHWLDGMLLVIITAIVLFVLGLLAWVILRFNSKSNKTPASFTHNSPLEVAWTIVPIVILVFIGAFSLPVLFKQQEIPEGDINISVTGYQWYWGYEYVDEGVYFDAFMIGYGEGNLNDDISGRLEEAGYSDAQFRLATDNAVVIPVGATVVMNVTGADVIHSWTIPAFGVKQDAVPGRTAQLWFTPETEGVYFGQCSELCGKDHAYMPITVKVVSPEVYEDWLTAAKEEFPA